MRRLIEQVYGGMPREFARPQRQVVDSTDELVALVDQYNGLSDCFVSAHAFAGGKTSYDEVVINKSVFDFDGEWGALVRAHEYLEERDVAHFVVFSGSDGSGHLYVLVKPTRHQQSLEYFQRNVLIDRIGLRSCKSCGNEVDRRDNSVVAPWHCPVCDDLRTRGDTRLAVDSNLVGDITTMIRIPNTWNPGAERFCVPLRPEEVTDDPAAVAELAAEQRDLELGDIVCGSKTPDITQHKERAEELYQAQREKRRMAGFVSDRAVLEEFEADVTPAEMMENIDCECVRSMVTDEQDRRTKPALGHEDRRILITYLVEEGYNPEEISRFLRFALDEEKAKHSIVDEEAPVRLWRDGVRFPNAVSLKRLGLFRQDCPVHAKAPARVTE